MRLVALLAALLALPAAAQTCTPDVQQRAAATLALQAKLLAVVVAEEDVQDIPPPVRPVLHSFKQTLIDTVDTGLRCNHPAPDHIQPDLAALLHANRPQKPPTVSHQPDNAPQANIYGDALSLAVHPVAGQPDIYTVQLAYGIPCGGDNILLVYRRTPQGYQRQLVWQNPDLNTIGDAFGDIFYFAPVPAPVPAFIVLHGHPWCTSNLSGYNADLVALAGPGTPQHLLDHLEADYRRDGSDKFLPEPDGFEFKTSVETIDSDVIIRPAVMRFATTSGHIVQLPVESSARAFVDSWLSSDWKNVSTWGDPASTAHLKQLHDDLNDKGADFNLVAHFGPTLACAPNHYQVELEMQSDHATAQLQLINLPSRYAQVRTNAASFTLLDVTDKPDPTCKGPDLMQQRSRKK